MSASTLKNHERLAWMKLFAIMEGGFEYHDVFVTRREWIADE
jgi:hypothetical protein